MTLRRRLRRHGPPDTAISVSLLGGLGNQLFQYALGLELSRRNECDLYLIVGDLGIRSLEVSKLPLPEHVSIRRVKLGVGEHLLRKVGQWQWQGRVVTERGFAFDPKVLETRPPALLFGYFQSWRYFSPSSDSLREQLRFLPNPSAEFRHWRDTLMELGDFIAVQARRGDYLQLAAYHGLASDAYFRRALDVLDPSHDYPVVIFTDDTTGWVPKWAEGRQNIVITPSQIPDARENLVLMSKARRFVISNSSFGWWGAWLASDTDPLVIAPRPWFAERSKDTTDLLPPRWLTMDLRAL